MRYLLTCVLLLCPIAAAAQPAPASVSDCERIKNDLAYNQCLASFGPKQGERSASAEADDDNRTAAAPARRSPVVRRGGRQAATFDVLSDQDGAARPARSRQRR